MGNFDRKLKNEQEIKKKKKFNAELNDKKNESQRNKRILDNILSK